MLEYHKINITEYHKIHTIFERDPETKFKTLLENKYSRPEFEYLKDNLWLWTEKIDGTNIRIIWDGNDLMFGGKTDNAQIPPYLYKKLESLFPKDKFIKLYKDQPMILYGEGYGAKIQKSGGNYIADGVDFILFDVNIDSWWLQRDNIKDIADKLSIRVVPEVGYGTLLEAVKEVKRGPNSIFGAFIAEGLVLRPFVELKDRAGRRIITKIKYKDFIRNE